MKEQSNLYALLVGINEYASIRPLRGCEQDVRRVSSFLEKHVSSRFQLHIKTLLSGQARKSEIVWAFKTHLIRDDVKAGDVVLFYFSGHGAEEDADEVFWSVETNRKLQVLACHDSAWHEKGKSFLADKELRYLINQAAKPGIEVVVITDCCHSGDNTRLILDSYQERLYDKGKTRHWDDFIFGGEFSKDKLTTHSLEDLLPQGTHIHMAACASHESAWEEVETGGIFTTALLHTLDMSKGSISYLEIKNKIRNFVGTRFNQSPQFYSVGANKAAGEMNPGLFKLFLGGTMKDKPLSAEVYFSKPQQKWILDKGAVYGVTKTWEGDTQRIVVNTSKGETALAEVKEVYAGFSTIEFSPYADVLTGEIYNALVPSLAKRTLQISLEGDEEGISTFNRFFSGQQLQNASIMLVDDAGAADYVIIASRGDYYIALPKTKDPEQRPLTQSIQGYQNEAILENLEKIAMWAFVRDLRHDTTLIPKDAVTLEVFQNANPIDIKNRHVYLNLPEKNDEGLPSGTMQVDLVNNSDQTLSCALVYIDSTFKIKPWSFEPGNGKKYIHRFERAGKISIRGGQSIRLSLEKYIQDFNWPEEIFYLQLIVSPDEFEVDLFFQKGLEAPKLIRREIKSIGSISKNDWRTCLYTFHLPNTPNT